MLQQRHPEPMPCPGILCLTDPDFVTSIHRAYVEAGTQIVCANTFGMNRYKLKGSGFALADLVPAAVACARAACGPETRVALDVSPIGQLLEPYGTLSFEEAYEMHREVIELGAAAGADLIFLETMTDLYELKAAVLAAKECTKLPVFASMTFEENGRTFTGCTVEAMAAVLEGLGVDALGMNCSLGPQELYPLVRRLCAVTSLPVILKPNAGLPDPATGAYGLTPAGFAEEMERFTALGVAYMGGCCGTTPEFIRQLTARTGGCVISPREPVRKSTVCTPTNVVIIDGVRVIGERINPTGKKRFQQALRENDLDYILVQAVEQADAGAHILDVNVGLPGIDEPAMMVRVVKAIQSVTDLPLQLDSSDPAALEAGLRVTNGKAIINSVNGEADVLAKVLPLAKKYGAAVVGLTMDAGGIPPTAEQRFAIAERILHAAQAHGIPKEDVFIDCLTLTVSAEQDKAIETLKAMRMVRDRLGLHCVLGVSNISFGLPARAQITAGFLTLAMAHGLDLPIINPNAVSAMNAIRVFNVICNVDKGAEAYIAANAAPAAVAAPKAETAHDLSYAIAKGLGSDARRLTKALLAEGRSELEVVNGELIPALDAVGARFEKGEIFLPQLINAAGAAQEAFEVIKTAIAEKGAESVSRGKLIVATVKGDIHDIGKNIVKTILENYGYTVIDLGRDVAVETVVETAVREQVQLIGLSALMTTTLGSMRQTIQALRESGHPCKVWVGGAVLTPEYAAELGADFYARDAKESVAIAREVLG